MSLTATAEKTKKEGNLIFWCTKPRYVSYYLLICHWFVLTSQTLTPEGTGHHTPRLHGHLCGPLDQGPPVGRERKRVRGLYQCYIWFLSPFLSTFLDRLRRLAWIKHTHFSIFTHSSQQLAIGTPSHSKYLQDRVQMWDSSLLSFSSDNLLSVNLFTVHLVLYRSSHLILVSTQLFDFTLSFQVPQSHGHVIWRRHQQTRGVWVELDRVDFLSVSCWGDVHVTQNVERIIVLEEGVFSYPVEHTRV